MDKFTYTFPQNTIQCQKGNYIIKKCDSGKWKVFFVEDIVLLSRLVPLSFEDGTELIEEKNILDSVTPDIYLLVTLFEKEFVTNEEANESISKDKLGKSVSSICLKLTYFSHETSFVYKEK